MLPSTRVTELLEEALFERTERTLARPHVCLCPPIRGVMILAFGLFVFFDFRLL